MVLSSGFAMFLRVRVGVVISGLVHSQTRQAFPILCFPNNVSRRALRLWIVFPSFLVIVPSELSRDIVLVTGLN